MVGHVLVFPFPAQGHINSMLKLAELLSLSGLHVTFLNTDYNHHRIRSFSSAFTRLALRPGFRFVSIPDGLPDDDPRSTSRLWDLDDSLRDHSMVYFKDFLVSCKRVHAATDRGWQRLTCAIIDSILPYAIELAEDSELPVIPFRTASVCSFWAYFCIPELMASGELPFPENADLDEKVSGVPGMESFLRRRDLPSFCREAPNSRSLQLVSTTMARITRARAIIVNSFESLEGPVLAHMRANVCPTIFSVGPLQALLDTFQSCRQIGASASNSGSLWPEDRACMPWLDAQPHRSVVYVSFGSFTVMSPEELLELWQGLVNSGHRFLWVMRADMIDSEAHAMAWPMEGAEAAKERGCVVGWAPQQEVLAHPAVGCFLTHSGWNSTMESVVAGVPMICWPFFADQQINSRFVDEVWRIGLDMKDVSGRRVVERMVREAMEGKRADELRKSAAAMAQRARNSVQEQGSSCVQFQNLLHYIDSLTCGLDSDSKSHRAL